jgi:hypothetical protein
MARQYFIPGFGFIDAGIGKEYLIPGMGFIEEEEGENVEVSCSVDSLSITTFVSSVKLNANVSVGTVNLSTAEGKAFVEYPTVVQAEVCPLTITTYKTTIPIDINLLANVCNLTIQSKVASVKNVISILATSKSLTLQTYDVVIEYDRNVLVNLTTLDIASHKANINARTNVLALRKPLRITTYQSTIFQWEPHYGDWRDWKGQGAWAFTEQQNKWGYLNNPRWKVTPQTPVNYTGNESNEPQIWTPPGGIYSANGSGKHLPCGHWHKVAILKDSIYVPYVFTTDVNNYVSVFNKEGDLINRWGTAGTGNGEFGYPGPWGISVYEEEVYVLDSGNNRVQIFSLEGVFSRTWGSFGTDVDAGEIRGARDMVIYNGIVYLIDPGYGGVIQMFNPDGTFIDSWVPYDNSGGSLDEMICIDDETFCARNLRISVHSLTGGSCKRSWTAPWYSAFSHITNDGSTLWINRGSDTIENESIVGTSLSSFVSSSAYGALYYYNDEIFSISRVEDKIVVFSPEGTIVRSWLVHTPASMLALNKVYVYSRKIR